jgi:hypothetical protein
VISLALFLEKPSEKKQKKKQKSGNSSFKNQISGLVTLAKLLAVVSFEV